jgi:phosphate transporter
MVCVCVCVCVCVVCVCCITQQIGIEISFLDWMLVSVPFASACTLLSWGLICLLYRPDDVKTIPIVVYDRENKPHSVRNVTVMLVSVVTMISFASFSLFKPYFGDIAMVALMYASFMFGSGILTELDFNSLSWHTLFLLAGGDALGKAVESSGLLVELSQIILAG